jgi:hypothetical protein
VRHLRRIPAVVFAGERRVWIAALGAAVPLLALLAFYCLRPVDYYTGTDSVEVYTYVADTPAGQPMCVRGLQLPADTGRIRLQLISRTSLRPALVLKLWSAGGRGPVRSSVGPARTGPSRISTVDFVIPRTSSHPAERPASLCVTAGDLVNWGGTPLPALPRTPPTVGGRAIPAGIAAWYLPQVNAQRSYLSRAGEILRRAALLRTGFVGPWLYVLILAIVLPGLALASIRCLALACARDRPRPAGRRTAAALFAIAAVNFACWALITPPFQAPDEIDHFAYTETLVQRGEAPSRDATSPLPRWSSAENLALVDSSFFTDHQVGDTRLLWSAGAQPTYRSDVAALHPSAADGGGNETAATHGPIYYAALAPAYMLASNSPLDQLTLMRLTSALIGALTVLFTFLLARELAPGREWPAVLAALLVAYQPMYGFISGTVNNDVGVDAGAAALELLLILIARRGMSWRLGLATGALLLALPIVKGTAYSLYPVAGVALAIAAWRHHRRSDLPAWGAFAAAALAAHELATRISGVSRAAVVTGGVAAPAPPPAPSATGAVSEALAHPLGYIAYLWEVFLPRLPFMAPHFESATPPAFVIFVERGWGAFGWYDVLFPHWIYEVIFFAMLITPVLAVVAARREWAFVRARLPEVGLLMLMPIAVVGGFEAAFYTVGLRPLIAEFGRYIFPAIAPLAVLVVASLQAFGRRRAPLAGVILLVAVLALSYSSQLLTLTGFYA